MSDSPLPLQIDSSKEILEELMATPSPVPVESGQTSGNEEATPCTEALADSGEKSMDDATVEPKTVAGKSTVPEEPVQGEEEKAAASPAADADPEESSWSNFFRGSLNAKGMKLGFVPPMVNEGKSVAHLLASEVDASSKKWMNSVIFYVIGMKPTMAAVYRFIAYQWNTVAKPKVFMHDEGYFIISFANSDDLHEIFYSGPHMFFGKPAIVKIWSPSFNLHDEVLRSVPIWVKLPNLPLNCWSMDSLSRITSVLGVPVCADECTTRQLRISFARVLVDIDVTKPLPKAIWIQDPNGNQVEQTVRYEWTPPFCKTCNKVGHDCLSKKKPEQPRPKQQGKQQWVPKPKSNTPKASL